MKNPKFKPKTLNVNKTLNTTGERTLYNDRRRWCEAYTVDAGSGQSAWQPASERVGG
jgi:hypothetical protein